MKKGKLRNFFTFLTTKSAGDEVTTTDILDASGWAASSFATEFSKNKLDPFIESIGVGRFKILKDGKAVTEEEVEHSCTQVRPGVLVLSRGLVVRGERETYELISEKGRGAIAHVWKCSTKGTTDLVAVKMLHPRTDLLDPEKLPDVKRRFARESTNPKHLSHPNVIRYLDRGDYGVHPFLVMELAEQSLGQVLKAGPISLSRSLVVIRECLSGLAYLHAQGGVHRDIKPDNILQFADHWALGDLGIVRWSDMNPAFTSAGTITRDSMQLGSWHYMASEQRKSPHEATSASDVFALGMSWYEMLTGRTLDPGEAAAGEFDPATDNTDVQELIRRMLLFKPALRPGVDELLNCVEAVQRKST